MQNSNTPEILLKLQEAIMLEADRQDVRCVALLTRDKYIEGSFFLVTHEPEEVGASDEGSILFVDEKGKRTRCLLGTCDDLKLWAKSIVEHTIKVRAAYKKALEQTGAGE